MKEKPILFNTDMVSAILEGRKTQTRRVMNPQPNWVFLNENDRPDEVKPGCFVWYAPFPAGEYGDDVDWDGEFHDCPYGEPGDIIPAYDENGGLICGIRVTSIRVERLQKISDEDARAEGIERNILGWVNYQAKNRLEKSCGEGARSSFKTLWDSISGNKPGRAWADNPWVWVIEFKRV